MNIDSLQKILLLTAAGLLASCSPDAEKTTEAENTPKAAPLTPEPDSPETSAGATSTKRTEAANGESSNAESNPPAAGGKTPGSPNPAPGATPGANESDTDTSPAARFAGAANDDERIALLRDLAENKKGSPDLAAVLASALTGDFSPEVRNEAVTVAADLENQPAIIEKFSDAIANAETDTEAIGVIKGVRPLHEETRLSIIRNALTSEFPDARKQAVQDVAELRPKYRIDYIFPSLEDPDPSVRQTASDALQGLMGRTFDNSADASQWWGDHAHRYDERINLVKPLNED